MPAWFDLRRREFGRVWYDVISHLALHNLCSCSVCGFCDRIPRVQSVLWLGGPGGSTLILNNYQYYGLRFLVIVCYSAYLKYSLKHVGVYAGSYRTQSLYKPFSNKVSVSHFVHFSICWCVLGLNPRPYVTPLRISGTCPLSIHLLLASDFASHTFSTRPQETKVS